MAVVEAMKADWRNEFYREFKGSTPTTSNVRMRWKLLSFTYSQKSLINQWVYSYNSVTSSYLPPHPL
ncbi:hypothetical protein BC941DRAFT_439694 [Chlamydoabsidia padenii]|nr:hypothetical protein BC941DRAFT_439694 [Chlamydoabsidia padenii]